MINTENLSIRDEKFGLSFHDYFIFFSNCDAVCQLKKLHIYKIFKGKILFFVYNVILCCYINTILQWTKYQ